MWRLGRPPAAYNLRRYRQVKIAGEFVGAELHAGRSVLFIGRDDWQMGRDRVKGPTGYKITIASDR